jgi:hypothetical protein
VYISRGIILDAFHACIFGKEGCTGGGCQKVEKRHQRRLAETSIWDFLGQCCAANFERNSERKSRWWASLP